MRIQLKGYPQLQTPITEAIGRFEATGKKADKISDPTDEDLKVSSRRRKCNVPVWKDYNQKRVLETVY